MRTLGQTQRELVVRYDYNTKNNRLTFQVKKIQGIPSITAKTQLNIDFNSVKDIEANLKHGQYKWTWKNKIMSNGRKMTIELKWNKV